MFARYFCDYQHKTLGEYLYRQCLSPWVCFEVLIPLCMYSLLGAAFVVNHLALSEKDSLCGPGDISLQESSPVCGVWETRPGPAFSVLYNPCYPRKTCTFKCKAHSTLGFIPKKTLSSPSWPPRRVSCCFKYFGKKSSQQKPSPQTNKLQ